jgi:ESX secretion-associated protein EspC/F
MSGDDLRVTTAHLVELSVQQVRAAADIRSATFAVEGVDAAVSDAVSDELGNGVAEAASRYDRIDDASGRTLEGQVLPG